jgi:hypothetical protein
MGADRKQLKSNRHTPLSPRDLSKSHYKNPTDSPKRSVGPDRPVHGHRIVRELSADERRSFNGQVYEAIETGDAELSTFSFMWLMAVVERLLEDKVSISYASGLTTPLHAAAARQSDDVLRALLNFGMDPNPTDGDGKTPLAVALQHGNVECAQVLREFGGVLQAHTRVERVSAEELDALAGGMSGMSGTGVADDIARLGETMGDVKMGDGEDVGEGPSK